jgi:hypothetical protein
MSTSNGLPKVVVHAVHGTWPYGLRAQVLRRRPATDSDDIPWFLAGSSFHSELVGLSGRTIEWVPFEWSGANSFARRHAAAMALSVHCSEWFSRLPESEHIVIAHSHGGSVAISAARNLDAQGEGRLTKIITMATPFAQTRISDLDDRQLLARYLALRFGWISIVLFFAINHFFPTYTEPTDNSYRLLFVFGSYTAALFPEVDPENWTGC